MGFFSKRRNASKLNESSPAGEASVLSDEEADSLGLDVLTAQGLSTIEITTNIYMDLFGIDHAQWKVDVAAGEITFMTPERRAVAPVQVIGTYDPATTTWLWGWDHPSTPESAAIAARRVYEFGQRNDLPELTTRKLECTEADAWRFTQLAVRLGTETGAYRGPTGGPVVFMTFGPVTVSKP